MNKKDPHKEQVPASHSNTESISFCSTTHQLRYKENKMITIKLNMSDFFPCPVNTKQQEVFRPGGEN